MQDPYSGLRSGRCNESHFILSNTGLAWFDICHIEHWRQGNLRCLIIRNIDCPRFSNTWPLAGVFVYLVVSLTRRNESWHI